jgi:uncharacterized protein
VSVPDSTLVELKVMGIALDTRTGTPIVVLNDVENRRALPIWIGTAEASAIIRQLEEIKSSRPMTHDLMQSLVSATNFKLLRIEIHDLNADTYYAHLVLQLKDSPEAAVLMLDSRPSDAIALALRMEAPIFATPSVVSEGTISTDQERDEKEAEAFRDFLSGLKASDFKFDKDIESDQ